MVEAVVATSEEFGRMGDILLNQDIMFKYKNKGRGEWYAAQVLEYDATTMNYKVHASRVTLHDACFTLHASRFMLHTASIVRFGSCNSR